MYSMSVTSHSLPALAHLWMPALTPWLKWTDKELGALVSLSSGLGHGDTESHLP